MRFGRGATYVLLVGVLAIGAFAGNAHAGTLSLSCEELASGISPTCPASAPMYAVPGQYGYLQQFSSPQTTTISGSNIYGGPVNGYLGPAGFIDDYFFQIAPAQADVVSSTIGESGVFNISNLFAEIYSLTSNPGGLVTTTPLGTVDYATILPSGDATYLQINPTLLTAGSYVLQISGTANGTMGGSYQGDLNLTAVPLPAPLWLLLSGLGALGTALVWRSRVPVPSEA
jgi:hypothetical protein